MCNACVVGIHITSDFMHLPRLRYGKKGKRNTFVRIIKQFYIKERKPGPAVYSASNSNECQKIFLEVKRGRRLRLAT
jgi:hypothetical protein